jgi:hypothetical protein
MTATEDHITPHIGRTEIGGLPFAYQRSVLCTDPDRLSDALKEIEDIRKDPDSKLKDLKIKPHPRRKPGFLELTGPDVDALYVRDMLRADRRFTPRVRVEPAHLVGMTVRHGHGAAREGIYLVGVAPSARSKEADLEAGRRPVVAVLDTPVREHSWLGNGKGDDAFWRDARRVGDPWTPDFEVPEESVADGLLSVAGHGTFIAGLVRLLAPDARVLSVPVMHGNGVVEDEHALDALHWLRDRASEAVDEGRPERFIDVVNLSFGLYQFDDQERADTEELRSALGDLARLGVQVVASAGNEAVDTRVFPAVLSEENGPGHTDLVSVGARDPDGTLAAYTSTGGWVTVEAPGTSVVSALPEFDPVDADDEPTGPDPNFQTSGVGQWTGTSFAAAWVSASIAGKLLEEATSGSLVDSRPAAAGARATSAVDAVVADIEDWVASHGVVN